MREEALASCRCRCYCWWMEEKKSEREQKIVRVITVFLNDSFFSSCTVVREPLPRVIHSIQWIFLFPSLPFCHILPLTFSCFFRQNGRSFVRHKSSLFAFDLCACDARHTKTVYTPDLFFLPNDSNVSAWKIMNTNQSKAAKVSMLWRLVYQVAEEMLEINVKKSTQYYLWSFNSLSRQIFYHYAKDVRSPSLLFDSLCHSGKKSLSLNRRHRNHG